MNLTAVAIVALGFLLFGLASRRLSGSFLTGPLLFSAFGLVVGPMGLDVVPLELSHEVLHTLAEVTLILVLFTDAANIDLGQLRRDHNLPVRMLALAMPLSIVLTSVAALALFGGLSLWEAALLAAILAPTDAALGQAVVGSASVPIRIRQALNVESGLNDGIALPLVLIFASLASAMQADTGPGQWVLFGLGQVTLGPVAGVAVGYVGGKAVAHAYETRWMSDQAEGLIALALAFLAFALAELIHGNGFIAAFVAGLTFGNTLAHKCSFLYEFAEAEGLFLILMTFFIFGGAMLPEALGAIEPTHVLLALLSLTVLRMIPVWASLLGTGVQLTTTGFLGWFGPRGLASVLFVLLILEETEIAGRETIFVVVMTTVMLSIVFHGITAGPASRWYGKWLSKQGECEEIKPVSEEPFVANLNQ